MIPDSVGKGDTNPGCKQILAQSAKPARQETHTFEVERDWDDYRKGSPQ
jgi:hypothetical protein